MSQADSGLEGEAKIYDAHAAAEVAAAVAANRGIRCSRLTGIEMKQRQIWNVSISS